MNKVELVKEMAKDLGSANAARAALDSLLKNVSHSIKNSGTVKLTGLGTFKVIERKARKGRHPITGKEINIGAKKTVRFVPSKKLKTAVE